MSDRLIHEEDVLDFINSRLSTPKSTVTQRYIIEFFPYDNFKLTREDSYIIEKFVLNLANKEEILITYRSTGVGERVPIIEPFNEEKAKKIILIEPIEKRINLKKLIRNIRIKRFLHFLLCAILAICITLLIWNLPSLKISRDKWEEIGACFILITLISGVGICWFIGRKKK